MRILPLLAAALIAAPTISMAQGAAPAPQLPPHASEGERLAARQFQWLDTDNDGYLSREEVAVFPRLAEAFDRADTNGDRRVSFEELRAEAANVRAERQRQREAAAAAAPAPAR
jgi:hypothetical protein